MSESIILSRDQLAPITIQRTGNGWRTPEIYANVRKLGLPPSVAASAIQELLKPEMAKLCGVPEGCVSMHCQQSWVDPGGRLVFYMEAFRPAPSPSADYDLAVIDLPSAQRNLLEP